MIAMKNLSISKTTIYLVLLVVALIVYVFAYFLPAQREMAMIQTDISVFNAETAVYRQYLADPSTLEADIEAIQAEINRMHAEDYTNDSSVSFEISGAIQRYRLSVSSVTLSNPTSINGYRALPINVSVSGDLNNLLGFISHFEDNTEGAYLAQGASIQISGTRATATLLIYLCSPKA